MTRKEIFIAKRAANKTVRNTIAYLIDDKIYCTRCMVENDITDLSRPILKSVAEKQECICTICKNNILHLKQITMNKKMKRICVWKHPFTMIEIPEDADPEQCKADWLEKHAEVGKFLPMQKKQQQRREIIAVREMKVFHRKRTK